MLKHTGLDAIRAVVTLYLEGMIWGQPDKLRQSFHPKAAATGHFMGTYWNTQRDDFIADWMTLGTLPAGTPYDAEIVSVDVTGDVAMVKVTNTCFGDDYTDYLTLIKARDQWQITHKAWFAHPRVSAHTVAKGYWIAQVDVSNIDGYRAYIAANAVAFAQYGARFLTRGAAAEVPEGRARARIVVLEFPSLQAAQDCYHSPEYAQAKALRVPHSEGDIVIIEGYDGPQPGTT